MTTTSTATATSSDTLASTAHRVGVRLRSAGRTRGNCRAGLYDLAVYGGDADARAVLRAIGDGLVHDAFLRGVGDR